MKYWRGNYPGTNFPQTQEIYFDNGSIREIRGIVGKKQGKWTHIFCDDKSEVIVNPDKVLFVRITNEDST